MVGSRAPLCRTTAPLLEQIKGSMSTTNGQEELLELLRGVLGALRAVLDALRAEVQAAR